MRRFERRGTEAPMDFEYERQDRDLGPGWTPFREVIQRQRSQNSDTFSANPSLQQTHGFQSQAAGFGPSATSPTISQPSSSGWAALGGFGSQPSMPNADHDLMDISMDTVRDEDEPTQNNQDGRDTSPSRKEKNSRRGSSTSASPERRVLKEKDMNRDRERDKERGGKSRKGVVTKRRQTDDYGASDGDDEAEQEIMPVQQYGAPANHFSFHIPAPTQFQHVDMPSVLSRYIQTGFYLSIVIGALYLFIKLVWAVQRDVEDKITEYSSEILHEISLCSKLYLINRCNPETRVPALTATCEEWERCMNRDPRVVGRGRVFIETIAEMYNTFFEGIGYKAFAFSIIGGGVFLWSANAGFSFFRSKHSSSVPMMPSPSYPDMVHPHAHLLQPPPSAGGRAQSPMVSMLQAPGQWREGSPAVGLEWVRARNGDAGGFAQPTTSSRRR